MIIKGYFNLVTCLPACSVVLHYFGNSSVVLHYFGNSLYNIDYQWKEAVTYDKDTEAGYN